MVVGESGTASMAATRPPVTAGPMARACMPPKVLSSSSTGSGGAAAAAAAGETGARNGAPARRGRRSPLLRGSGAFLLLHLGHGEAAVGDLGIDLDLVDGDRLARRGALRLRLDGVREDDALDRLVVAEDGLELHVLPAHLALPLLLDLEEGVGIQVEV